MGKRGPKPVNVGELAHWEFEFYKAFHLLRDGTPFAQKFVLPPGLTSKELRGFIKQLKQMGAAEHWLTTRRVALEFGEKVDLRKPPTLMDLEWAERERREELYWLEREADPPPIKALGKRRIVWRDLLRSNTFAALRKVCGRWARLPDVRGQGMTPFPRHVLEKAAQFLSMKNNKRFPRSSYGDDARLEYLARGMAGAICGVSPMTAIERLRNMKHQLGGPMWVVRQANYELPEREQYCGCWRCRISKSNEVSKVTREWYQNGLRVFVDLAKTTKVPVEWKTKGTLRRPRTAASM